MLNFHLRRWIILLVLIAAFIILVAQESLWENVLSSLFPDKSEVLHPRASLNTLVWEHIQLVVLSSGLTILIGLPLGIWVTRRSGKDFLPLVTDLTSFGQTFPPIAVLALAVPVMGFGREPTILALFLYGLLPVVRNTIAGLQHVPRDTLDAAYGMGMSRLQAYVYRSLSTLERLLLEPCLVPVGSVHPSLQGCSRVIPHLSLRALYLLLSWLFWPISCLLLSIQCLLILPVGIQNFKSLRNVIEN